MSDSWLFLKYLIFEGTVPFKRISDLKQYLWFRKRIEHAHATHNFKLIAQYRLFIWILAIKMIHLVYNYLVQLDKLGSFLHMDGTEMVHLPKSTHVLISCPLNFLLSYFFYELYLSNEDEIVMALENLIEEKAENFYRGPFQIRWSQRMKKLCQKSMLFYNSTQFSIVAAGEYRAKVKTSPMGFIPTDILMLFIQFIYWTKLVDCWNLIGRSWWLWLYPFIAQAFVIHGYLLIIVYFHTSILLAVLGNFILTLWAMQWKQLRLIQQVKISNPNRQMECIMMNSRRFLLFQLKTSPQMSKNFFAFLIVNCPINSFIVILIILNKYSLLMLMLLLVLVAQQMFCIVGIHFLFARSNGKLIEPTLRTINLAVQNQHRLKARTNLRLSLFIQTFHTKRKYGLTYWKFGLISFSTFFKASP